MINKVVLNNLYSGVLIGDILTTKKLCEYGFNLQDISSLVENGVIEQHPSGFYTFKDVENLYFYGKKLIAERRFNESDICFEKCHELDPNHLGATFQLFLRSIQAEDYTRAFELYDSLVQSDNVYYNQDYNFYLYLLSIITYVPEKYQEYVKFVSYDDIYILDNDTRYQDIPLQNKARLLALQKKFSFALKQIRDLIKQRGNAKLQDIIITTLLKQAIEIENIRKNNILELIEQQDYEEVINCLLDKKEHQNLGLMDEYTLRLCDIYLDIYETSKIPIMIQSPSLDIFRTIDNNDFETALKMSIDYNKTNNVDNNSNAIYLMLNAICNLIQNIKKQQSFVNEGLINNEDNEEVLFSEITTLLTNKDYQQAIKTIRNYLASVQRSEYEFLVVDLIKISLLENDNDFVKTMSVLSMLSNGSAKIEFSSFLYSFYSYLVQGKFAQARIYLDIFSNIKKIGQECIITGALRKILDDVEEAIGKEPENTILKTFEETINQASVPSKEVEMLDEEDELEEAKEPLSDEEILASYHEKLYQNGGIILLEPMSEERINQLIELNEYQDIAMSIIEDDGQKRLVLRFNPTIEKWVNVNKIMDNGNNAYANGNYDESIKNNLFLLGLFKEPRSIVYAKLGLAYMKKGMLELAVDYLTIANYLSKQNNSDFDYTELIIKIKGQIIGDDRSAYAYKDVNDNYGIDNFEEINDFILASGLDVESACQALELSDEQIYLVKLIYARGFYIQGDLEKGDTFLKSVEKSPNKTKEVIKIYEMIKKNKMFFQNRQPEDIKPLNLCLVPNRKK